MINIFESAKGANFKKSAYFKPTIKICIIQQLFYNFEYILKSSFQCLIRRYSQHILKRTTSSKYLELKEKNIWGQLQFVKLPYFIFLPKAHMTLSHPACPSLESNLQLISQYLPQRLCSETTTINEEAVSSKFSNFFKTLTPEAEILEAFQNIFLRKPRPKRSSAGFMQ